MLSSLSLSLFNTSKFYNNSCGFTKITSTDEGSHFTRVAGPKPPGRILKLKTVSSIIRIKDNVLEDINQLTVEDLTCFTNYTMRNATFQPLCVHTLLLSHSFFPSFKSRPRSRYLLRPDHPHLLLSSHHRKVEDHHCRRPLTLVVLLFPEHPLRGGESFQVLSAPAPALFDPGQEHDCRG